MGTQRTGERLESKPGPSMVLPLKAGRKVVGGESISGEAISGEAIMEEAAMEEMTVEDVIVDDAVIVDEVVMSETIDSEPCGGEDGTRSLVCMRMLNSRLWASKSKSKCQKGESLHIFLRARLRRSFFCFCWILGAIHFLELP